MEAGPGLPKRIRVETPLLTVRFSGTRFLLGHQPAEGSRLLVLGGQVEARPRGRSGGPALSPADAPLGGAGPP